MSDGLVVCCPNNSSQAMEKSHGGTRMINYGPDSRKRAALVCFLVTGVAIGLFLAHYAPATVAEYAPFAGLFFLVWGVVLVPTRYDYNNSRLIE